MIGNKGDLEAQRDVTYEEAKQFAEENGENSTEKYSNALEHRWLIKVCASSSPSGLLFLEASAKT